MGAGLGPAMAPVPCVSCTYPDAGMSLHMTKAGSRSAERIWARILFEAKRRE